MRHLRLALPTLLLTGLIVSCPVANADPPAPKAPVTNKRVTLYKDGKRTGLLMFYGNNTRIVVTNANATFLSKTKTENTVRLTGDVKISIAQAKAPKSSIKLAADEILIETIPDQPLPSDF